MKYGHRGVRDGLGARIIHVTYIQSHPRGDLSKQLTVVILRKESMQESWVRKREFLTFIP